MPGWAAGAHQGVGAEAHTGCLERRDWWLGPGSRDRGKQARLDWWESWASEEEVRWGWLLEMGAEEMEKAAGLAEWAGAGELEEAAASPARSLPPLCIRRCSRQHHTPILRHVQV